MKIEFKIMSMFLFFALMASCISNESDKQNLTPPILPEFDTNKCDTIKLRTYKKIQEGKIDILFSDTFHYAIKGHYLDSIIEKRFKINHVRVFNKYFENCIQPIMDSAIAAKFGANAKDSIINEAIEYKKNQ